MIRAVSSSATACPPWTWPWWCPMTGQYLTFFWAMLIHMTAIVGLVLYPLPGWLLFLTAVALTWLGGLGTTVCYHRGLAHRALRLHPVVRDILTFFALTNSSGAPQCWTANHRFQHATADTVADMSSPQVGGFWWAHLRWLWQADQASPARYCPDLETRPIRSI